MAKSGNSAMSGGGKWSMPSASTGAPVTSPAKSKAGSSVAGANKHANTAPHDFSIASTASAKNKHHGG